MDRKIGEIARKMGAEVVGTVPEYSAGAFGVAKLAQTLGERLEPGRGKRPGRPSVAHWSKRSQIPLAAETEGRLRYAFELCTAREPDAAEKQTLSRFLAGQLDDFQTDPKLAAAVLRDGAQYDKEQLPQLAAWTATARVLMNLDEFITRE